MRICNLASSSDGNCTYIEENGVKILIDAGLSCAQLEQRLSDIGVSPSSINAIFITHEHTDHIKGVNIFASKHKTDVFTHKLNWNVLDNKFDKLKSNQKFEIADVFDYKGLKISTIEIPHDAVRTTAYRVDFENKAVSVITDIGNLSQDILNFAKNCPLVYLESNHDPEMLKANPKYSPSLKRRILGDHGHLSNMQSARAIEQLVYTGTRQFVLSHLSQHNNLPQLAYDNACEFLKTRDIIEGKHLKIDVASPHIGHIFRMWTLKFHKSVYTGVNPATNNYYFPLQDKNSPYISKVSFILCFSNK